MFIGAIPREFLQGAGQGWKYQKSNYMFSHFAVNDKEYSRHEAEMARKMAEVKPATQ